MDRIPRKSEHFPAFGKNVAKTFLDLTANKAFYSPENKTCKMCLGPWVFFHEKISMQKSTKKFSPNPAPENPSLKVSTSPELYQKIWKDVGRGETTHVQQNKAFTGYCSAGFKNKPYYLPRFGIPPQTLSWPTPSLYCFFAYSAVNCLFGSQCSCQICLQLRQKIKKNANIFVGFGKIETADPPIRDLGVQMACRESHIGGGVASQQKVRLELFSSNLCELFI